jgi:hypothetical protein
VTATDLASALETWRPQLFGKTRAQQIPDPLIEPVWEGPRVLISVDRGRIRATDIDGTAVELRDDLLDELRESVGDVTMLLEGCLSDAPLRAAVDFAARSGPGTSAAARQMAQLLLGDRAAQAARRIETPTELPGSWVAGLVGRVALIALDLLWIDTQALDDVPLLERKRLLESVIRPSELVRMGVYVRPPIDKWIASWRSSGFDRLAYKAANSRYYPGERNNDWAIAQMPAR